MDWEARLRKAAAAHASRRASTSVETEHLVLGLTDPGLVTDAEWTAVDFDPLAWRVAVSEVLEQRAGSDLALDERNPPSWARDVEEIFELARREAGDVTIDAFSVLAAIRVSSRGHIANATASRLGLSLPRIRAAAGRPHRDRVLPSDPEWASIPPDPGGPLILLGGGPLPLESFGAASELAPADPSSALKVLVVMTAAGPPWRVPPGFAEAFAPRAIEVVDARVHVRADAYDVGVCRWIAECDVVFFEGGRPEFLHEALIDTPAMRELADASQRGAVIMGASAGAMVWGSATMNDFVSGAELRPMKLFAWLPDTYVFPHYIPEWRSYLEEDADALGVSQALGVAHDGAVLVEAGWERVRRVPFFSSLWIGTTRNLGPSLCLSRT